MLMLMFNFLKVSLKYGSTGAHSHTLRYIYIYIFFFEKNTGTQKTICLDFTIVMLFDLLCKRYNNKDGFYCQG